MSVGLSIRTHKPAYIAGETVTGDILVNVSAPTPCSAVTLRMKGYQKSEWDYVRYETERCPRTGENRLVAKVHDHEAKKEYFKDWIPVLQPPNNLLPAGNHQVPFSYTLPEGLPGVFAEKGRQRSSASGEKLKYEGKIVYKVKAVVDIPGRKDVKCTQKLAIYEKLADNIQPATCTRKGTVFACCCIPRGELTLKAYFDQNHYQVGQPIRVFVECENNSSRDIPKLKLKLMRILELRDEHNHKYSGTFEITRNEFEGVKEGEKVERNMSIVVPGGTPPTTFSQYVRNHFRLDVEADVPMAKDIEAQLKTIIFAPQPTQWGATMGL